MPLFGHGKEDASSRAVFSEHCHFHVSHDDNGLTLSGCYPASCAGDRIRTCEPEILLSELIPPSFRPHIFVPCGRCDLPPLILGCNERTAYNNSPQVSLQAVYTGMTFRCQKVRPIPAAHKMEETG